MTEYWESRFKNEGAMWKSEPSDSAIRAMEYFKRENINKILIPGFGYGRNGRLFIENGFNVTGIEISGSAIDIARKSGIECVIHHGSVTSMPYDNEQFEGIFCYALIHLLNKNERKLFLKSCFGQLKRGGVMIFTTTSKNTGLYGHGRKISKDRFEIAKGLIAYFYDASSIMKEFSDFGLVEHFDIEEPVKFMTGEEPVNLKYVICRKQD
jgi:ubiquinone/menaquinone biosynthesis C-methylase UbiE